ncbi:MAG: DNA repair protein RecN [Oscillospiraceae bacterium]|nr:DNA repair protein RecN [Oscillospiraceae bacterium]MCL2278940.1 DNA repair protein RecN [Oscillospiraceae bacterium]
MLKLLQIENVAVIEKAEIEFTGGLNVLTGETGAGKSIVIDSLSAATGHRTSREIIRTGAEAASVTAVFETTDCDVWLNENAIEPDEDGEIFISRKISADGKSVCRINGTPVPVAVLRELGAFLLDIHGQNDGRKLLDEGAHLDYLDVFGMLDNELNSYKEAYGKLMTLKTEIDKLTMDESEKERQIDLLKHQISEIEQAKISPGEQAELAARRELLQNASKLTESVDEAFESLYGGGETVGALERLSEAGTGLDRAVRYSEKLRSFGERISDVLYTTQDIADELRDFRAGLDFTPDELDHIEGRLDVLKRITRKYGGEEEALAFSQNAAAELSDIEDSGGKLAKLEAKLADTIRQAQSLSEKLSAKRKKAAKKLSDMVKKELSELNMPGVKFTVEFSGVRGEYGLGHCGGDEVWYLMSANEGEAPGRINKIASGGELARIMLALKNVLSSGTDTGSMVFDEIDTGVSGIAAQRVGEKLATLAIKRQVLCVTHLPQIAAMADTHFSISKSISESRTFTHVERLDHEGRKKELARLSGGETITDTTLKSAAEQLKAAEEYKVRNV